MMLAANGSMHQLKYCGFVKIKDQLRHCKLLRSNNHDEASSSELIKPNTSTGITVSSSGKLTLGEMKKLTSEEKRLYLTMYVMNV